MRFFTKLKLPALTGVIVLALLMVPVFGSRADAALLTPKSIALSSSALGGGGGTAVIYTTSFTVSNAATNIGGIVIDFCSNSAIVGDTCTAPTGLNTNKATLSVNSQTNISGLSVDTTNSTANTLILTKTAGAPSGAAISFALGNGTTNGFTNPTSAGTFYARIYTYTTSAAAQGHTTASPSGYTDQGSVALAVASQVGYTFDVPETLTFCVYTGANCAAGGNSVTLGDTKGFLSPSGPFVDKTTKFDIITNAVGASPATTVFVKGNLPTFGANTIAGMNPGSPGTAAASVSGTSQFGICGYSSTGQLTMKVPYNNGSSSGGICSGTTQTAGTGSTGGTNSALFGFDTPNTTGTYGSSIATADGITTVQTATIVFIGNISAAQVAGTYTTAFSFIAVSQY